MLRVITDARLLNNKEYVRDVVAYFDNEYESIICNEYFEYVIKNIDKSERIAQDVIRTPFGVTTVENISTGSKALLVALSEPGLVVNFLETGDNVLNLALDMSDHYDMTIYLDKPVVVKKCDIEIEINNKRATSLDLMLLM